MIYGITEDDSGLPESILGLHVDDLDSEISKISNLIRNGISPRIWDIKIQQIKLNNGRYVFIIRIPNSWSAPHRVDYKGHHKFYTRSTNGKYPMDVNELRVAFTLSDTISERANEFISDRINSIYTNQTIIPIDEGAKFLVNIIPYSALTKDLRLDLSDVGILNNHIKPYSSSGWSYQYNINGFIAYSQFGDYTQLYRSGIFESVCSSYLKDKVIPGTALETKTLEIFYDFKKLADKLEIKYPLFFSLSLLGIKDCKFTAGQERFSIREKLPNTMDILNLPSSIITDRNQKVEPIFKPIFDTLWNAFGHPKSPNFESNGNWKARH